MNIRKVIPVVAVAALILLAGCTGNTNDGGSVDVQNNTDIDKIQDGLPVEEGVYRVQDEEAGVVCYVAINTDVESNSIDCVKLA